MNDDLLTEIDEIWQREPPKPEPLALKVPLHLLPWALVIVLSVAAFFLGRRFQQHLHAAPGFAEQKQQITDLIAQVQMLQSALGAEYALTCKDKAEYDDLRLVQKYRRMPFDGDNLNEHRTLPTSQVQLRLRDSAGQQPGPEPEREGAGLTDSM